MRLPSLLVLLTLPLCFALSTQEIHQKLLDLNTAGKGIIKVDQSTFDLLVSPKRTWSATIQFTALDPRRRCGPCSEFEPAWQSVAKAWGTVAKEHRNSHFFATVDFDTAQSVFTKLNLASAPIVYVYPAAEGPRAPANKKNSPLKYDFSTGFDAGPLAEQMSIHTPVPIPYRQPINWGRFGTSAFGVFVIAATIKFLSRFIKNRWTWAVGCILISLVMTSGLMFTRIRGSPWAARDGGWIASGFQNQFGQEVQVVAAIYGLLSFAVLMLTLVVPLQTSPQRQRLQVYLWSAVIFIIYSMLISLFRIKNKGYPFKLFL